MANGDPILTTSGNPLLASGTPVLEGKAITGFTCRLSLLAGSAFITNPSIDLTSIVGKGYKISLTATNTLVGWIKAAGTGETYGNIISGATNNGNMETGDPPTGWTSVTRGAAARDTDPHSGTYSCKLTRSADGTTGFIDRDLSESIGRLLIASAWMKNVTTTLAEFAGLQKLSGLATSTAATSYTQLSSYVTVVAGAIQKVILRFTGAENSYGQADDVDVKRVLTPSATGVTIKQATDDDTENWTSDGGIDPNATSFTLTITKS